VYQGIVPILTIISSAMMSIGLVFILILISPLATLLITAIFMVIYYSISRYTKKELNQNSQTIAQQSSRAIKILREGLGGIRDVIIDSSQERYLKEFKIADKLWRGAQGNNLFISQSPRLIVEAIVLVLIASAACYLTLSTGNVLSYIPFLGAMGIALQRLLPAFQQIYGGLASIQGNQTSLQDIAILLKRDAESASSPEYLNYLSPSKGIYLKNVCFQRGTDKPLFENINIEIPKGARLAVIGATGTGKSTLLDLIMGLLPVTSGEIYVDDIKIDDGQLFEIGRWTPIQIIWHI
jgi:ATP-binding cassette subfamily B protein